MIAVSDAWKAMHQRFLLPETFVEISCAITEVGVQEEATASGEIQEIISDISGVTGTSGEETVKRYATLEPNLWLLDGSRNVVPTEGPYANAGYVSNKANTGSVTLRLSKVHTASIPGVTITWSREYGEYATAFTVTAKKGTTVVAETTVTDNKSNHSLVYLDISNYDSLTVTVHAWSIPNHRTRIDLVRLGLDLTFTKQEILHYTHEQTGCLVSGELPKNSIEFSLDNSDNRWNPHNPTGLEQYLSEQQRLTVRYGMDIDGTTEWIPAGVFYLSEWRTPANGLEASFVARDPFEFWLQQENPSALTDQLSGLVETATSLTIPAGCAIIMDASMNNYNAYYDGDGTQAEIVQKAANAGGCIIRCARDGNIYIEPLSTKQSDFTVTTAISYGYPEMTLSKRLAAVSVDYGANAPYVLNVGSVGETQTVENSFITTKAQATMVAGRVKNALISRQSITGEFRADPRLDVFDVVSVESKYGVLSPVVLTSIKYDFSGAFKATYKGQVLGEG